jgi:hypothetical protein
LSRPLSALANDQSPPRETIPRHRLPSLAASCCQRNGKTLCDRKMTRDPTLARSLREANH